MLKVAKFGGSSLADEKQFAKVKSIISADEGRKVIVVSAPGKRSKDDNLPRSVSSRREKGSSLSVLYPSRAYFELK